MSLAIHRAMVAIGRLSTPAQVVCCGDSNTFGFGVDPSEAWPIVMSAALNGSSDVYNVAVSGDSIQDMIDLAPTVADDKVVATAQFARGCKVKNLCIIMGGTNRDAPGDLDPWVQWQKMKTFMAARRAAGFSHVIVMGILKAGTSGTVEGRRVLYQAYAEGDSDNGKTFHYANHDSVTELQDPTNATNFQGDQTHLEAPGQTALGNFMADFVNDLTGVAA